MAKGGEKRSRTSQMDFPATSFKSALRIAEALWEQFAGRSAAPHQVALALELSPASSTWRTLSGAAIAYGLTEGGYNAAQITLTALGRAIVAPIEEGASEIAKRQAVIKPRIMNEFFQKYDRGKFPKDDIGVNVLTTMGIQKEKAKDAFEIIRENGKTVGIILETKTGLFVALEGGQKTVPNAPEPIDPSSDQEESPDNIRDSNNNSQDNLKAPKHIFVAHGKNRKPLDDLKKILDQFGIPYKIAVDEAHAGRPISKKVGDLMRDCSAGIFIFTRDEKFLKEGEGDVWRPSENVVYELGAASVLWDKKIIIVREEGVNFPSDFSDLGYISFREGELSAQALNILKELVGLGLVRVQPA